MQTRRLSIYLVALTGILTTTVQVGAQQVGGMQGENTVNVDFAGGRLQDLLEDIEGSNDVAINIVVSEQAKRVIIPELQLRNVRVEDLLRALNNLGLLDYQQFGQNLYSVTPRSVMHNPRDPGGVQIYDVRALVTEQFNPTIFFGVDDIVTAMRIAWEMGSQEGKIPTLKFHEETYLLVVYGNSAQQRSAKTVLETLAESQMTITESQKAIAYEHQRKRENRAAAELSVIVESLKKKVSDLEEQNRQLRKELEATQDKQGN